MYYRLNGNMFKNVKLKIKRSNDDYSYKYNILLLN